KALGEHGEQIVKTVMGWLAADFLDRFDPARFKPVSSTDATPHLVGKDSESATITTYTAAELSAMDLPDAKCVVHGLIPDGLTVLAGKPKLGKSWLALLLALAVAMGRRALAISIGDGPTEQIGLDVEQGHVLYLALEDTKR